MTDPVSRWKTVIDEIKRGFPIVLYTKAPAPLELLTLPHKNFALSYTITGWGGTWLEPNVPAPKTMINSFNGGAQMLGNRLSLRVDPVVPTSEGFARAAEVLKAIQHPTRVTTSILQLYQGHEVMAKKLNIDGSIYNITAGRARFVHKDIANSWIAVAHKAASWTLGRIQMCGMPYEIEGAVHTGCIDEAVLESIGITDFERIPAGRQRPGCKCVIAKRQLMMGACQHHCAYCYAHKENLKYIPN